MSHAFTTREALTHGWEQFKANVWFILALMLAAYVLSYLAEDSLLNMIVGLVTGFLMASSFLRISRGAHVDFTNLLADMRLGLFVNYVALTITVTIFIFIGIALLIVPGVIIALMLSLATFILLDTHKNTVWNSGAFWQSMKESRRLTDGHKWQLLSFFIIALVLNVIGALAFGLGLLVTIPVTGMAVVFIYDRLKTAPALPAGVESKNEPAASSETTHTN